MQLGKNQTDWAELMKCKIGVCLNNNKQKASTKKNLFQHLESGESVK